MVDNALDHIHLVFTRHEVNQRLAGASQEIHELNKIGIALSAERVDPAKLLEMILTKSREKFTGSDAGSVSGGDQPRTTAPVLVVQPRPAGNPAPEEKPQGICALSSRKMTPSWCLFTRCRSDRRKIHRRVCALTGEIVNIEDAYSLPAGGHPLRHQPQI